MAGIWRRRDDVEAALAGGNRIAVETDAGEWEVLGFAGAELIAPGRYRLTRSAARAGGSDHAIGAGGGGQPAWWCSTQRVAAAAGASRRGSATTLALRAFAGRHDATGTAFAATLGLGAGCCRWRRCICGRRGRRAAMWR